MEIQNNPIISLACYSLFGEDDEDTSGVIIENLTMQPNILLIFKSDYSFLRLTSYISVYYCRLDIEIIFYVRGKVLVGSCSLHGPPWM